MYGRNMTNEQRARALRAVNSSTREAEEAAAKRIAAIYAARDAGCRNTEIAQAAGISERGIYKLFQRQEDRNGPGGRRPSTSAVQGRSQS